MTTEAWTFADYRLGDTVLPEPNLGWNMYGTGLEPGSTGAVRLWGWRVHEKGLLTWENAVKHDGRSGHVGRHFW